MQTHTPSESGFFNPRIFFAFILCSLGLSLAALSLTAQRATSSKKSGPAQANRVAASQPPFAPVPNSVTNGGLTVLARVFTPGGWVRPGEGFPVVLTYQAGGTGALGATVRVTLHDASLFLSSTPPPASGNGTPGSPLVYSLGNIGPSGAGQIVIEARAKDLTEDPEVMWKDVSADVTLQTTGQPALACKTHGPKVTTLETARYGDRPFPVVMVQYQDVKHCTAPGVPFPECTGNHTAQGLDVAINSRSTGTSVWQLYQDMSFGQLYVDGRVSPAPNSPDTLFAANAGYPYKWSYLDPQGACTGTTFAPPPVPPASSEGAPLPPHLNRIEGGWYLLPGSQGYYGSDRTFHGAIGLQAQQGLLAGIDDACGPTGKAAYDAAAIADPDIDYNDFDTDKDGVVDFFNMVFAGDGGNLSVTPTGLNNIWPHSSDLRQYFKDTNGQTGYVSNDQFRNRLNQLVYYTDANRNATTTTPTAFPQYVRVGPYNVNPESALDAVSVIAHEYGHSLGLPDFYSTGGRSTFGSWELMGSDHFQYMTVFARQDLGWVVPRRLSDGPITLTESKFDTGQIHWNRPDGTPYTLTGPGIHNADVYRLGLPPRILIDEVPSGVNAWYSQAGNDFGCAVDGGAHNLDFFIPDLQQHGSATTVTLKFKHLYEIEWDYDYGFVLVSEDNGITWTSLASQNGSTTLNAFNPNANQCQSTYNNGITGVSDGNTADDTTQRAQGQYPPAIFINDQFDLTPYKGKTIILRFSYSTDPGLAKRGWFIDDIEITADTTVVYQSDFEGTVESSRIFPNGWVHVNSAQGSPADHAYYLELRDRISNDFDGKGESDRGAPTWQGGVSMIYTDEAHGYGNFGVDDPPAQTPVDSVPEPGNDTPNLNDAAFTTAAGRNVFDGCTHIDNYDAEPGANSSIPWKLPPYLNFTVTGLSGMTGPAAPLPGTPATATILADIYPDCATTLLPPVLSIGAGYENPDTDGSFQLTWTRPLGAVGPDQLQVATSCGPTFSDDASEPLAAGENSNWAGSPQWVSQINPSDSSESYYIADGAAQDESLTMKTAVPIPAGYSSTLTFTTRQGLEAGYDFGHVEVSANNGVSFKTMISYTGPAGLGATPADVVTGQRTIDLSEFAGQSVIVRFRVESDSYNEGAPAGWYIDNIAITNSDWTDVINTTATSFVDHKASGTYCYRVRTTYPVGAGTLVSEFSNIVNVTVAPGVMPVVSRKTHGITPSSPVFDLDLPATGTPGIECRQGGGANGNTHRVVFFFADPVTVSDATVTPGSNPGATAERDGSGPPAINANGTEVTVDLKNVSNAQTLMVNLLGVSGTGVPSSISVPMSMLVGDTNANGRVNASDVSEVKSQSGQPATDTNFRRDVNANGSINASDTSTVKAKSGTALPTP